jgi:hypothetical protein
MSKRLSCRRFSGVEKETDGVINLCYNCIIYLYDIIIELLHYLMMNPLKRTLAIIKN